MPAASILNISRKHLLEKNVTNLELLTLAAKTIGAKVVREAQDGSGAVLLDGVQEPWNPLNNDGDAFDLSCALKGWNKRDIRREIVRQAADAASPLIAGGGKK
jgi:hypothetical protein